MLKPLRHFVQLFTFPEHSAQLELQGTQLPPREVNPEAQLATHLPLLTMPELQRQTPLTGAAPEGQVVWQRPWKK
jgi:hypothetical protein